jgi:hypothetical protein
MPSLSKSVLLASMETNTFFNCTCKFCSTDTISSTVCFSMVLYLLQKYCSTNLVKEVELQAHIPQESKLGVTLQLTKKTIVDVQPKIERRVRIHGSDILPDGNIVFAGKRLLMFSNNGNYEKDIVQFVIIECPFCF